ncbi:hypothetical protein SLEP1_g49728 [Rubroshorea leprosula]|uniref:Uncharacterized protein n=1 Tax=Rubroshorea leprosula TaxID=152421 RepID=A0AAV5M023_9ROSI|nr:hypothetical protein SLEP1_g49728 [Rubroshorea leprosula]
MMVQQEIWGEDLNQMMVHATGHVKRKEGMRKEGMRKEGMRGCAGELQKRMHGLEMAERAGEERPARS